MPRFVVTGAPGTGKTSVIDILGRWVDTVAEPARALIAEHARATGEPSLDGRPELLVQRLVARALDDFRSVSERTVVVFDRGLPDCVAYASAFGLDAEPVLRRAREIRYDDPVFVAPPWREIYTTDDVRRATYEQVEAFHTVLQSTYIRLGYELLELPKASPRERADMIAERISASLRSPRPQWCTTREVRENPR